MAYRPLQGGRVLPRLTRLVFALLTLIRASSRVQDMHTEVVSSNSGSHCHDTTENLIDISMYIPKLQKALPMQRHIGTYVELGIAVCALLQDLGTCHLASCFASLSSCSSDGLCGHFNKLVVVVVLVVRSIRRNGTMRSNRQSSGTSCLEF